MEHTKAVTPTLSTRKVVKHLGGYRPAAKYFGVTFQAVYAWGETVPPLRAAQLAMNLAPEEIRRLEP